MSDECRPSILCALKGMFSFFTMIPINIEKKHMDTKVGKRGWDELGDWNWDTFTTMCKIDN